MVRPVRSVFVKYFRPLTSPMLQASVLTENVLEMGNVHTSPTDIARSVALRLIFSAAITFIYYLFIYCTAKVLVLRIPNKHFK